MKLSKRFRNWLFAPKSKFKVGDTVQVHDGDHNIMYVVEICSEEKMKEPLIYCQWDDAEMGTRRNLFPERNLEPFDWDYAYRHLPQRPSEVQ